MKIKKSFLFYIVFALSVLLTTKSFFAEEKKEEEPQSNQLIIINKSTNKLAMYENGYLVNIFSVATGASASSTPEGDFKVSVKWECPIYYKTNMGACQVGNPLGKRWIGLDVPGTVGYTYGIHGNAAEWSIGSYASAGCVRMHNWQVEQLFEFVEIGAQVKILRSNDSFDEIAKSLNYEIIEAKKLSNQAFIQDKTDSFYGLNENLTNDISFEKGLYSAVEEANGYIKIEDNDTDKTNWVRSSDVVVGDFTEYSNEYMFVSSNSPTFEKIFDEKNDSAFNTNRIVKPIISTGTWILVEHNNQELWLRSSTLKASTEKDFLIQKEKNNSLIDSLIALTN